MVHLHVCHSQYKVLLAFPVLFIPKTEITKLALNMIQQKKVLSMSFTDLSICCARQLIIASDGRESEEFLHSGYSGLNPNCSSLVRSFGLSVLLMRLLATLIRMLLLCVCT